MKDADADTPWTPAVLGDWARAQSPHGLVMPSEPAVAEPPQLA